MFNQILVLLDSHGATMAAIGAAIFFLYKIRAEETLRTRLKLIYDCYHTFATLNEAVQDWTHPSTGEDQFEEFVKRISNLSIEARKHFHFAAVLMRPETIRSLNSIFQVLDVLPAQFKNWQMYKSMPDHGKQTVDAFKDVKCKLPSYIQKTTTDLLTDFQIQEMVKSKC